MRTFLLAVARGGFAGVVASIVIGCLITDVRAQTDQTSHEVGVSVERVSYLSTSPKRVRIQGRQHRLSDDQRTITVADHSSRLVWRTNGSNKKITAALARELPRFSLAVEATDLTGGRSSGKVSLSSTPTDLLMNVGRSDGQSDLTYEASAAMNEGNGRERATVIYTLTDQ